MLTPAQLAVLYKQLKNAIAQGRTPAQIITAFIARERDLLAENAMREITVQCALTKAQLKAMYGVILDAVQTNAYTQVSQVSSIDLTAYDAMVAGKNHSTAAIKTQLMTAALEAYNGGQ